MDEYFVNPEIAKTLQLLGFDVPCIRGVNSDGTQCKSVWPVDFNKEPGPMNYISVPMYTQCINWFRERFNIFGFIVPTFLDDTCKYSFVVNRVSFTEIGFDTPEDAYQGCVEEIIDYIQILYESQIASSSRSGEQEDNEYRIPEQNTQ